MRTGLYALLAVSVAALTGAALSADDPVAARRQLMKENGVASKVVFSMVKGRTPFDAAAAAAALNKIADDMVTFPDLFPPGSDSAPKTTWMNSRRWPRSWEPTQGLRRLRLRKAPMRSRRRTMPSVRTAAPATKSIAPNSAATHSLTHSARPVCAPTSGYRRGSW